MALVGWLVLCFAAGGIGSLFEVGNLSTWYAALNKPPLNPPNAVFPVVWTVLYALMAVSAWLVWRTRPSRCRPRGLGIFLAQLWFNFLWSWIFFGLHRPGMALVDIAALWVAILLTMRSFRKMSVTAAWLLAPYLAWVTFAAYLNFGIWRLNR